LGGGKNYGRERKKEEEKEEKDRWGRAEQGYLMAHKVFLHTIAPIGKVKIDYYKF